MATRQAIEKTQSLGSFRSTHRGSKPLLVVVPGGRSGSCGSTRSIHFNGTVSGI